MNHNKYIQITSGRGPVECAYVTAQVLKKIMNDAKNKGIKTQVIHREKGSENGTIVSAVVLFEGKNVEAFAKEWVGTIKWISKSLFRKNHKRKNWFIGVNEINFSSQNFELKESDLMYETFRSSGAGGQHVNKVETAVRAIHLPTGISATSSERRSQLQNKKSAREKLIKLLKVKEIDKVKNDIGKNWKNHNEIKRGNPIKTFQGKSFKPKKEVKNYKSKRNELKSDLRNLLK